MRTALLSLPFGLLPFIGMAQEGSSQWQGRFRDRPATVGVGFEVGIPVNAFSDEWGREIVGISANVATPLRLLPFDVGFDFAWGRMGRNSEVVAVDEEFLTPTTGELSVNSNVYGYHTLVRFKPVAGKISPYIEGMAGLRQFTTKSELRVDGVDGPIRTDRNANSFVGSIGWALGIHVAPSRSFYIEGRVERLNTGKVGYVDPSTVRIETSGEVTYETRATNTSTVNVHIGMGLRF